MMRFAELAAPWFETAEVIELHHDEKIDAPSGTAMLTVERMAAASSDWAPDPTTKTVVEGARGGVGAGGIHVHSVRLRGLVAHEEVLLGTIGQSLSIRHDSYDRTSFMPGVLLAVKAVRDGPASPSGSTRCSASDDGRRSRPPSSPRGRLRVRRPVGDGEDHRRRRRRRVGRLARHDLPALPRRQGRAAPRHRRLGDGPLLPAARRGARRRRRLPRVPRARACRSRAGSCSGTPCCRRCWRPSPTG